MCNHKHLTRVSKSNGVQLTDTPHMILILYNCNDCDTTVAIKKYTCEECGHRLPWHRETCPMYGNSVGEQI